MRQIYLVAFMALTTTPAFATQQVSVPEMEIGSGLAAIALLAGLGAIIREKTKQKYGE